MKVQLQQQTLRLRISEHELAQLQAGEETSNLTRVTGAIAYSFNLCLTNDREPSLVGSLGCWWLHLPRTLLSEYITTLPNRDGLTITLPVTSEAMLTVVFEVDVRDSVRSRGVAKRGTP